MDAEVRHGPARCLGAVRAPHVGRDRAREAVVRGEVALDLRDAPEGALAEQPLHGAAGRLPAPLVTHRETNSALPPAPRPPPPPTNRSRDRLPPQHGLASPAA